MELNLKMVSTTQLFFLDLSVVFSTIDHGLLLSQLSGMGIDALFYSSSSPMGWFPRTIMSDCLLALWQMRCGIS